MPVHDWTRVSPGIYHAFHNAWITEIQEALNTGVLPPDYYALGDQLAGPFGPDVLTLRSELPAQPPPESEHQGGITVALAPPKVHFVASLEMNAYIAKHRKLVIRHSSDDRIIALLEIVSPGNKASQDEFNAFVQKAAEVLAQGYHLLLIDLFPPGPRDPKGIHGALWAYLGDESYTPPPEKPLTLAAYAAGLMKTAYVEPFAVGDPLTPMPLFLTPDIYVNVPLEETYKAAYRGVPRRWKAVLEPPTSGTT